MTRDDLERPADLAVWPRGAAPAPAPARSFGSAREAVSAALDALAAGASVWIVVEGGTVLPPAWIERHAATLATAH